MENKISILLVQTEGAFLLFARFWGVTPLQAVIMQAKIAAHENFIQCAKHFAGEPATDRDI